MVLRKEYGNMKKIFLFLGTIIFIIIIWFAISHVVYPIYTNLNPDNVDLQSSEWKKILSFTTVTNEVFVEVYGCPTSKKNEGRFVLVRTGILPFNIKMVSPIYLDFGLFEYGIEYSNGKYVKNKNSCYFDVNIGFCARKQHQTKKYKHSPYLNVIIDIELEEYRQKIATLEYMYCDFIPLNNNWYEKTQCLDYDRKFYNGKLHVDIFNTFKAKEALQ